MKQRHTRPGYKGGNMPPKQQSMPQLTPEMLNASPNMVCPKCNNTMFMQVFSFKKLPDLLPTEMRGKIIPIPQWLCMNHNCNAMYPLTTTDLIVQPNEPSSDPDGA